MRLHRFFIDTDIQSGTTNSVTDSSLVYQLSNVFRLHAGDKIIFFNGRGSDYESEIVSLTKTLCVFRVLETHEVKRITPVSLSLAVSLIKKDNLEWVIQKGTEIGVSEFIPLVSERSEKKGFNMDRARKIMIEALEQSGRADMPYILEPRSLKDFLEEEKRNIVVFHTTGKKFTKAFVEQKKDIVACIGPEGGWSPKELEMFIQRGAESFNIHTPVLRAETAAVVVATLILV